MQLLSAKFANHRNCDNLEIYFENKLSFIVKESYYEVGQKTIT